MTPVKMLNIGVSADNKSGPDNVVINVSTSVLRGSGDRPPLFVPKDEIGFWTKKWQAGEAESARERAAGRLRSFDSGKDLLDWLDAPED